MSLNNPYQAYKTNSTQTASPGELTLMLYNGCLKFIRLAKVAINSNKIAEKHANILKAQDIIREFMVNLNMEYEVSKQMMQMYDYILNELVDANINNDISHLEEAERYVTEFRDTWKEVLKKNRQLQYGNSYQNL